jgi:ribokinase
MPNLIGAPRRRLFVIGSFVEAHCWFVPHRPGSDESQQASAYVRECAGKGLAVALGAHRLGAAVDLLLAVGHDAAGDALLQLLAQERLGAAYVHRLGPHSGQGCGLIDAQGDPAIAVYPGANALLGERELLHARPCVEHAAVAYAQLEVPPPLAAQALRQTRAAGAVTVLNPSPWPGGVACAGLLDAASILVVNRGEAQCLLRSFGLAGAPDAAPPSSLWRQWPGGQWLVITLGAQGCVAHARGGALLRLPGYLVRAEQPVGAGDAFSAGLCAALAHGQPMAQALTMANACGALAASRGGILSTLPCMAEVQTLLDGKTATG